MFLAHKGRTVKSVCIDAPMVPNLYNLLGPWTGPCRAPKKGIIGGPGIPRDSKKELVGILLVLV